ncbi:MAG TPA: acetolactate synthase [Candidatus Paceibacterota bacterium]|nr:acetolactate synthase [Verrucomicrobiota bacterium]HSA10560.1 acetolactate synthase [Candidatus Paceibacterota bacterium]
MSAVNLVAVFVENKPGQTARITRMLADAGVNLSWLTVANSGSFGVMKFLVDQRDLAVRTLKEKGVMVSLLEVLAVEVPNQPGSLQAVADLLGRSNINLENCSGFVANNRAILIIEVPALSQACPILEQKGFRLLTQEEMLRL